MGRVGDDGWSDTARWRTHLGQRGRGVLTSEPVHGSALGQWGFGSGRRRRGRGGALYSHGGRCGGGGVHRWPKAVVDGEAALAGEEEGGRLGSSSIPYGGRWLKVVSGLAWLLGARERSSVLSVRRLEQRSTTRGRVEWGGSLAAAEEQEGYGVSAWLLRGIRAWHTRGGGGCMGCV
jgi:hypothetical protein